jgi:hypothetical protein
MDANSTPRPNPSASAHGTNCPPQSDGDGGTRPCTWFDHDSFTHEQAAADLEAMDEMWFAGS